MSSSEKQKSKQNLPQLFKKGQSGNPGGRPKGAKSIKSLLSKFGEMECPQEMADKILLIFPKLKKIDLKEAVYLKTYIEAIKGEEWAVKFISDREEGTARQISEVDINSADISGALERLLGATTK